MSTPEEKLDAAVMMLGCDVISQQFLAAWDYICQEYQEAGKAKDFARRDKIAKIMTEVMGEDWLN